MSDRRRNKERKSEGGGVMGEGVMEGVKEGVMEKGMKDDSHLVPCGDSLAKPASL